MARHLVEEHVGELELRLEAPTLEGLFAEAGAALAETLGGSGSAPLEWERVHLTARDREALLVAWLNELIYRGEVRRRVFSAFRIERLGDTELVAEIGGAAPPELRTLVKAATFHGLRIRERDRALAVTVVLDI